MSSKRSHLTPQGKLALAAALIVFTILAYLLLFRPPRAEATKTKIIELKEEGGEYDGNLLLTRDSNGYLVITTPAGTVKMKDGQLIITGAIQGSNLLIGSDLWPNMIFIQDTGILNQGEFINYGTATFGDVGSPGLIRIVAAGGSFDIVFDGETGDGTFKGGMNLGTATGAGIGSLYLSGQIRSPNLIRFYPHAETDDYFTIDASGNHIYLEAPASPLHLRTWGNFVTYLNSWTGGDVHVHQNNTSRNFRTYSANNYMQGALHVGTASGGAAGDIKASNDIIAAEELKGKTLQLQIQVAPPPAASAAYAGMLWHEEVIGDADKGKLFICLRTGATQNYSWVLIAQGL